MVLIVCLGQIMTMSANVTLLVNSKDCITTYIVASRSLRSQVKLLFF